jgi:hypothetical protein
VGVSASVLVQLTPTLTDSNYFVDIAPLQPPSSSQTAIFLYGSPLAMLLCARWHCFSYESRTEATKGNESFWAKYATRVEDVSPSLLVLARSQPLSAKQLSDLNHAKHHLLEMRSHDGADELIANNPVSSMLVNICVDTDRRLAVTA